ncbi:MAG TPA: methylmalonyl Co-A mutase-associated GTPase MeaB [Acidimicrobiales bacterium]|nr:methylmalonyl Co-A mutase-associated GTPase MeaB [Acidimicrobiales bacterium]
MRTAADPQSLFEEAAAGGRRALARLLSTVEQGGERARAVAALAYRSPTEAQSVGVTGSPGAGKSTLVDGLITVARSAGVGQLAVLAVDPSSPFTGGAILGDRVRMQQHALDEGVYIRSMASRGHLGGLALAVPEAIRVAAAAGIGLVVVETVGVGQVEVEVASATDTTVVVVNPKWGDAVQANKAGLLEAADIFVVNKADMPGARETRRDLEQMLDLSASGPSASGHPVSGHAISGHSASGGWRPPVLEVVAAKGEGVDRLWGELQRHHEYLESSGELARRRRERLEREFKSVLVARIEREVDGLCSDPRFAHLAESVVEHRLDPYEAADQLVEEVGPGDH